MIGPETWRRLPLDIGMSHTHVVRSDALSRLVAIPTVWWHWTDGASIILGAGQTEADVDLEACVTAGIRVTKRSSGGTSVYANSDLLGLDVALPAGHPLLLDDVVESYRWLGEVWLETLSLLGVSGRLVGIEEARVLARLPQPVDTTLRMACFGSISPYEVVVNGRKLVGLSQVRRGGRALFQSGLYLRFEASRLANLLRVPDRSLAAQQLDEVAAGLDSAAGRQISQSDIINAFSSVLRDRLGALEVAGDWTAEELEHVRRNERGLQP
jgi:lipoate-protein ligase A